MPVAGAAGTFCLHIPKLGTRYAQDRRVRNRRSAVGRNAQDEDRNRGCGRADRFAEQTVRQRRCRNLRNLQRSAYLPLRRQRSPTYFGRLIPSPCYIHWRCAPAEAPGRPPKGGKITLRSSASPGSRRPSDQGIFFSRRRLSIEAAQDRLWMVWADAQESGRWPLVPVVVGPWRWRVRSPHCR